MPEDLNFLGRGWSFPPTFQRGLCGVEMLTGKADIESSLEILFSTAIGERVMQPRYGCNLDRLLFEPLNTTLQTYMKDLIETAIVFFEPRIILNHVKLEAIELEGLVNIEIDYTVAATNTRHNFVYPFYLNEGIEI